MEGFNVESAQSLSHVFHFFVSSGKACLVPFIGLYCRYLGLSAFQTGLVIGIQCMVATLTGPLWLYCANACRKRRIVLIFSLVICIVSGVLLSVVPSARPDGMVAFCNDSSMDFEDINSSGLMGDDGNYSSTVQITTPVVLTEVKPVSQPVSVAVNEDKNKEPIIQGSTKTTTTTEIPTPSSSSTSSSTSTTTTFSRHSKPKLSNWDSLDPDWQELLLETGFTEEKINAKDQEEFQALFKQIQQIIADEDNADSSGDDDTTKNGRHKRDIIASTLATINEKLASWQIKSLQIRTLTMVLVIIVIAEVLSAPIETLADMLWFEFLDGLDFLERYGSQRVWSCLGLIISPLIVTAVVDHSSCALTKTLHHFVLHFYFFALILCLAFVLSFCFPIFNEKKKVTRNISILKGCRVIFTDVHAFCYVFTILLLGAISAPIDNFLFWRVQDLGGAELYMGGAVSLAAVSQFFFLALSKLLIRKMSNPGCIIFALLVLAVRLVIYSFLWAPWVVLPTALLYGFSHTLIWSCIENYQDFKANPLIMDRSAKALIENLYKGFAYSVGSMVSGLLYESLGWGNLLQGAALVALSWSMMFAVLQKCIPHKQKVRYAKLLQAEEDQESDEEESVYNGDWLEIALKHDK